MHMVLNIIHTLQSEPLKSCDPIGTLSHTVRTLCTREDLRLRVFCALIQLDLDTVAAEPELQYEGYDRPACGGIVLELVLVVPVVGHSARA